MELFIETLTGSSMALRVSPQDTIHDIKAYIQKLEGIPMSQQHLVWQSNELEDERSLQECCVYNGATLRLVLNMRGGPVNTRRVPVEEPSIHDVADYFAEASRSDLLSSSSSHHRPVTVVVCQSGDQLNFYRLMPAGSASPAVSCSHSSSDDCVDDDDELQSPVRERHEENDRTRNKMKAVRLLMENRNILKEKRDNKAPATNSVLPRAPSTSRPVGYNRLRKLSSSSILPAAGSSLNCKPCLPPVGGQVMALSSDGCLSLSPDDDQMSSSDQTMEAGAVLIDDGVAGVQVPDLDDVFDVVPSKNSRELVTVGDSCEQMVEDVFESDALQCDAVDCSDVPSTALSRTEQQSRGKLAPFVQSSVLTHSSSSMHLASDSLSEASAKFANAIASALNEPEPATVRSSANNGNMVLRSLNSHEMKTMSGILSSLIGSGHRRCTATYIPVSSSSSCTRPGLIRELVASSGTAVEHKPLKTTGVHPWKLPPMHDRQHFSPLHQSSPISVAETVSKTLSKRCALCGKKTRLANSFQCRCGGNFCSIHRYAETHACTFDYKAEGRQVLEQNNPLITAPKLPKI